MLKKFSKIFLLFLSCIGAFKIQNVVSDYKASAFYEDYYENSKIFFVCSKTPVIFLSVQEI